MGHTWHLRRGLNRRAISGKPVGKQFNVRIDRGNYSLAPVYSLRNGRVIVCVFADILIFLDLNTFNPTMSSHFSDKTNNYHMHHPSLFLHNKCYTME